MVKHTSRLRSMLTFAVLVALLISASPSGPVVAQPIVEPESEARGVEERHEQASKTPNAFAAAYKKGDLVSYAEPKEQLLYRMAQARLGPNASMAQIEVAAQAIRQEWAQSHYHGPDPQAHAKLLHNEQRALAAGSSPAAMGLAVTGTLRLFAVAVEFAGTDTVSNFSHPMTVFDDRTCITETLTLSGPLHNQIPQPGPRDNFSLWRPAFEKDYYEKLVFSTEGITERVRMDLTDPEDGKPGINIAGQTMRNYFDEVSGGRVKFDGGPRGVIAWIQVPHSEAYYGADACIDDDAGDFADMEGLPTNPEFGFGPRQLVKDMISQINATDPNFPWADYDTDGDGIVDHVVIFHAGKDKSGGGGQQTWQALWAHRGTADNAIADDRGTPNPSDDIRISGYTLQYEDVEAGVLVHEFGHDLGLPDLYDTSRGGESSVVWWDLMSTGSNTGKLIGTHPTHMSAWSKTALGWAEPEVISPTADIQDIRLGQTSRPPGTTEQAVRVDLPPTPLDYTTLLPGSTQAWWSNNDQNGADVQLTRDVNLTGKTAPISLSFDIDWAIEQDYDYLFVEVSIDGGATYTSTKGLEVGTDLELTTTDDPTGNLSRFGGPGAQAYNGVSGGWVRAYHDLSAYANQQIKVRFRYATDESFLERGAFIDNIRIDAANGPVFNDPVEGNNTNGWTATVGRSIPGYPLGAGWVFSTGTVLAPKYYLLEWRTLDGFDKGLLYTYNTIFFETTASGADEWRVEHVPSNVPGMLVYLRDTRYGKEPFGVDNSILDPFAQFLNMPSEGPKGGLLVIDAHPDPLRAPRNATIETDYGIFPYPPFDNWSGRVQTTNAAFTTHDTPPITLTLASGTGSAATTILTPTLYAPMPGVAGFHDALGYYPGVEQLPQPIKTFEGTVPPGIFVVRLKPYAFSDPDASAVVPAKGYYPPRTPPGFTGSGAETNPPSANISTFETVYYHGAFGLIPVSIGEAGGFNVVGEFSGHPGSFDLQYGNHFQILGEAPSRSYATIRLWNSQYAADLNADFVRGGGQTRPLSVTVDLQNVGSPAPLTVYSDFNENQATYVEGSATNGAVPVRVSATEVEAAVRSQGLAALRTLAVAPGLATAVVWTSPGTLDSGDRASFSYALTLKPGVSATRITQRLFGPSLFEEVLTSYGTFQNLPLVTR